MFSIMRPFGFSRILLPAIVVLLSLGGVAQERPDANQAQKNPPSPTPPNQDASAKPNSVHLTIRTERDYANLDVRANRLTTQELHALRTKALAADLDAEVLLGMAYEVSCPGTPADPSQARDWFTRAADQGSSLAENEIGGLYEREGNSSEAAKWFRRAAERGDDAVAQYNLGALYGQGAGVPRDYMEADRWFQKAAENGSTAATLVLVNLYENVKPFKNSENRKRIVGFFQELATRGLAGAQAALGESYDGGWLGLRRDDTQAVIWYRKAAEQGFSGAQRALGDKLFYGQGLPRDRAEAVKWLEKAANQGDQEAQQDLGALYESGQGVPKDIMTAFMWYVLGGVRGAKSYLTRQMSTRDLEAVEKRAREWKVEHGKMEY